MSFTYFAIRDDDTSFFTSPEDLDAVYSPYWGVVPISLATVPFSCPNHKDRSFGANVLPDSEAPIGENKILVEWLKEKIQLGYIEVMLHGYNHQYKEINGRWVGEYAWKPGWQLMEETARGKAYLENLFGVHIKVFVPPSNTIGKEGIQAVRKAGLNVSGVMGRFGDRAFSSDYLVAYCKRWCWRIGRGEVYPYPLSYGGHTELRAYALTPHVSLDDLLQSLKRCVRLQAPFVLATHYWEFAEVPKMHETLHQLVRQVDAYNLEYSSVSNCIVSNRGMKG